MLFRNMVLAKDARHRSKYPSHPPVRIPRTPTGVPAKYKYIQQSILTFRSLNWGAAATAFQLIYCMWGANAMFRCARVARNEIQAKFTAIWTPTSMTAVT